MTSKLSSFPRSKLVSSLLKHHQSNLQPPQTIHPRSNPPSFLPIQKPYALCKIDFIIKIKTTTYPQMSINRSPPPIHQSLAPMCPLTHWRCTTSMPLVSLTRTHLEVESMYPLSQINTVTLGEGVYLVKEFLMGAMALIGKFGADCVIQGEKCFFGINAKGQAKMWISQDLYSMKVEFKKMINPNDEQLKTKAYINYLFITIGQKLTPQDSKIFSKIHKTILKTSPTTLTSSYKCLTTQSTLLSLLLPNCLPLPFKNKTNKKNTNLQIHSSVNGSAKKNFEVKLQNYMHKSHKSHKSLKFRQNKNGCFSLNSSLKRSNDRNVAQTCEHKQKQKNREQIFINEFNPLQEQLEQQQNSFFENPIKIKQRVPNFLLSKIKRKSQNKTISNVQRFQVQTNEKSLKKNNQNTFYTDSTVMTVSHEASQSSIRQSQNIISTFFGNGKTFSYDRRKSLATPLDNLKPEITSSQNDPFIFNGSTILPQNNNGLVSQRNLNTDEENILSSYNFGGLIPIPDNNMDNSREYLSLFNNGKQTDSFQVSTPRSQLNSKTSQIENHDCLGLELIQQFFSSKDVKQSFSSGQDKKASMLKIQLQKLDKLGREINQSYTY